MEDEHKQFLRETIQACRVDVDHEIHMLRAELRSHTISEEQAEEIATRAALKAKAMTKAEIITDVKVEIGNASIEILKRAAQAVGLFIVGLALYIGSIEWPKIKTPWH